MSAETAIGHGAAPLGDARLRARVCKKDECKRRRQPDAKEHERLAKNRQSREDKRQEADFRRRKGHEKAPDDFPAAVSGLQQPVERIVHDQSQDCSSQDERHDMDGRKTQHQDESPSRCSDNKSGREKRDPLHGPEHQHREHCDEQQRYTRKPADLRLAPASRRSRVHGHTAHAVFDACVAETFFVDRRSESRAKRHKRIRVVRDAALQRNGDEHMRDTVLFRGENPFFQPPPRNGARQRSHKTVGKAKRVFRRRKQRRNWRRIILPRRCASKATTPLGGGKHRRIALGDKPGAAAAENVKDRRHLVAGKTAAHRSAVVRRKALGQRLGRGTRGGEVWRRHDDRHNI